MNLDLTDKEYKKIMEMRAEEEKQKEPKIFQLARDFVKAEGDYIFAINSESVYNSEPYEINLRKAENHLLYYIEHYNPSHK